jgi:acetyl esterase
VIAHGPELGLAAGRLLVGGDSAGGYIAAEVAIALRDEAAIAGQVLIYPLLQLDDARWAATLFADARFAGRIAVGYIRAQLHPGDLAIPSLVETASARTPTTLVVTGGPLDPVRPDARAYADNLDDAGVAVWRLEYPLLPHGFGNFTHVLKGAATAVGEIGRAMAEMARSAAPAEAQAATRTRSGIRTGSAS